MSSNYYMMKLYQRLSPAIKGHSLRVSLIMGLIVEYMLKEHYDIPQYFAAQTNEEIVALAREAGSYHDIGKISVPSELLKNQDDLTDEDLTVVRNHTIYAQDLMMPYINELSHVGQIYYRLILQVCVSHHERWDGQGYPYGIKGEEIPFLARVCSVANSFDTVVYGRNSSRQKTMMLVSEEILQASGSKFDPQVIVSFEAVLPHVLELLKYKNIK